MEHCVFFPEKTLITVLNIKYNGLILPYLNSLILQLLNYNGIVLFHTEIEKQ